MTTPQYIKPSAMIALEFTALEQKLLLDDVMFLNDGYAQIIRDTPIGDAPSLPKLTTSGIKS
jgi:hypothetical protein